MKQVKWHLLVLISVLAAAVMVFGSAPRAVAQDTGLAVLRSMEAAFAAVAAKAQPSVVHVRSISVTDLAAELGDDRVQESTSQASGFVVRSDGCILTNYHVVERATEVSVIFSSEKSKPYRATVVGQDPRTDLAVIKVDRADLVPLELGDSASLKVGSWVVAVGSPFGFDQSVTVGVVSALGRVLYDRTAALGYSNLIQTDGAINRGNSGGPLLNLEGKVVGVNTLIYSLDGASVGIGFAIPVEVVREVLPALLTQGKVNRGLLDVTVQDVSDDPVLLHYFGATNGVVLTSVTRGGPADQAGLRPDDVVVAINGQPVAGAVDLLRTVSGLGPDAHAMLTIVRAGQQMEIPVVTGLMDPGIPPTPAWEPGPMPEPKLGMILRPVAGRGLAGMLVSEVDVHGAAAKAGIRAARTVIIAFNGTPITSAAAYQQFLDTLKPGDEVAVKALVRDLSTDELVVQWYGLVAGDGG